MNHITPLRILVIGANYGLILAVKFAQAGHHVTVVGRAPERDAILTTGAHIEFPNGEILSSTETLDAAVPDDVDPDQFDIAFLAVQEPQAAQPQVASLINRVAQKLPIAAVMNLPPEPFLRRVDGFPAALWDDCHVAHDVWAQVPSARFTCASPDPQAFRPDPNALTHLRVSHIANFKFAPFEKPEDQAILRTLSRDIGRVRFSTGERAPIHIVRSNSLYTPFAKWPMLVTGNCRCVRDGLPPISICDAVHMDLQASRDLYDSVLEALMKHDVPEAALVRFEDYAKASQTLTRPSSLAMGLENGVTDVERIDVLVKNLLARATVSTSALQQMEAITSLVDKRLNSNRALRDT